MRWTHYKLWNKLFLVRGVFNRNCVYAIRYTLSYRVYTTSLTFTLTHYQDLRIPMDGERIEMTEKGSEITWGIKYLNIVSVQKQTISTLGLMIRLHTINWTLSSKNIRKFQNAHHQSLTKVIPRPCTMKELRDKKKVISLSAL